MSFDLKRIPIIFTAFTMLLSANVYAQIREGTVVPIPIPNPRISISGRNVPDISKSNSSQSGVQAPARIELSLADAIFLGLRNNRQIKSNFITRIAQKFDLRVAEDRFTPQFSIDGSLSRQRIAGVHSNLFDVSPGVTALTPLGTRFDFSWNLSGTHSDGLNTSSNTINLSIDQPLLRGAGYEVNMAPVNIARLSEKINRLRLKSTISETVAQIILAHRDLIQAQEELNLANEAVKRVENNLAQNNALITSGRMAEMDSVQTKADLENQRIRVLQAKRSLDDRRLNLLDLLNLDLSTPLYAKENLNLNLISLDVRSLFDIALRERQDYQSQLLTIQQNSLGLKVAENAQLWDISLFAQGTYGTRERTNTPDERISDGSFGLRFTIPINDLSRKQQLVQADVTSRTAELQLDIIKSGIEKQIRTSATEVSIYWEQAKTAETQLELSRQAVTAAQARLNAGRATNFEVQTQEQNLRNAESQLLNSRLNYLNALTRLDLQLGTTLDTWQIELTDQ